MSAPLPPGAAGPQVLAPHPKSQPPKPQTQPHSQSPAQTHYTGPITTDPPTIPVDKIIQEFAAHEAEFKLERDNFTYEQSFVVQTLDDSGQPDGEYRMTSDIIFTPEGERYEKITDAPEPTLTRVTLTEQDLDDLRDIQPFVLTTADLPKYNITYVGRQKIDELNTYVFDVAPKKIEKKQRYFQGRIWVDDGDLEIVKTDGKAVPDIGKGDNADIFPRFQTYRANIDGHFWFPVYTYSDDVLHFRTEEVRLRMVIRWTNYKRYRVSVKLLPSPASHPHP